MTRAWINFAILIFATLFFLYFYMLSVSPAAMEKTMGPQAYPKCARYRLVAILFEMITLVNYLLYLVYPLPSSLPERFPWSWWVSVGIAAVIGVPTMILMFVGLKDAGKEALIPKKAHLMFGGIYTKIRHPQAAAGVFGWLWIAFLLNSPFLVAFSFVYFPVFLIMCWAEESDLLIRHGDSYAEYCKATGSFMPKRNRR